MINNQEPLNSQIVHYISLIARQLHDTANYLERSILESDTNNQLVGKLIHHMDQLRIGVASNIDVISRIHQYLMRH